MSKRWIAAAGLCLMLLTGAGAPPAPADWGDDTEDYTSGPEYQLSKLICRRLKGQAIPAADRPTAAETAALAGCSSEDLYYGIGRPADPVQARKCAILELDRENEQGAFAGVTMLMTIYANGVGAKRNLDLATHYACLLEGAPAEMQGRIERLAEMKRTNWQGHDFDFCDHTTSGIGTGYCAYHSASIANGDRDRKVAALTAAWPPAHRQALAALTAAKAIWVKHIDYEVDTTGSGRASFMIEAEQALEEEHLALLTAIAAGKLPAATPAQVKAADADLNRVYGQVMKTGDEEDWGSVRKTDIRDTQRVWLRYRDAWLTFARVKGVSPDAVNAWLTARRTKNLKAFVIG